MSRWRLKSEAEHSPDEWRTFAQLAEMLADGRIDESDLVQSDFRSEWIPIDNVPGLLKCALRISQSRSSQETHPEFVKSSAAGVERPSTKRPPVSAAKTTVPGHVDEPVVSGRQTILHRPLPIGLSLGIVVVIGGVAWIVRHFWMESKRFPVPRHVAERPSQWSLPILGPVSSIELSMIVFDAVVLLLFLFWVVRRRLRGSSRR